MEVKNHTSFLHSFFSTILILLSAYSHPTMTQGQMMEAMAKNGGAVKRSSMEPGKLKIKVPRFDNTELIRAHSKTLIGRCMNPRKQNISNLLFMLPRIWKVEERVVTADLGLGKFQIDFEEEGDIEQVLATGPVHFDYWMVSLVRWEPVIDASYPSSITF